MISESDIARIQEELAKLALASLKVDVDGFIETADLVSSPQALTAGISPKAVASAGEWAEMARLLKPFRDHAVQRLEAIRREMMEADEEEFVPSEVGCPGCGERRIDALALNDDESVVCGTCGRRYTLVGRANEGVVCDCSAESNPGCRLASHENHLTRAAWRVSPVEDQEDFMYLCGLCAAPLRTEAERDKWQFEALEEDEDADRS